MQYTTLLIRPRFWHDPEIHRCRMEKKPPRYPYTKYGQFLISGCREIRDQKTSKKNLVIAGVNGRNHGRTEGRTDERMDGTDETYIPLRHTSYTGGIINIYYASKHVKRCIGWFVGWFGVL